METEKNKICHDCGIEIETEGGDLKNGVFLTYENEGEKINFKIEISIQDEFAHRYYDKKDEEIRYNDVYMIHSGKWIFIRFNPDDTKTIKVDIEDKLICLIETIQKHIDRIENEEPVEIHPLYFDLKR